MVKELGEFEQFPWLFSVYLLAQAVSVPIYSKLADTIGRKPIILVGVGLFLLGSVLAGLAWNMTSLIVFRVVQGLGAGATAPMAMTIVGDIYTVAERALVQGYIASVWAVASVVGPALGGIFSQFTSWRWIFLVNIPLCLLAGWALARFYRENVERRHHTIDYLGAGLLTVGLTAVILALLEGGNAWSWLSWQSLTSFGIGIAALVAFVPAERRAAEPVLVERLHVPDGPTPEPTAAAAAMRQPPRPPARRLIRAPVEQRRSHTTATPGPDSDPQATAAAAHTRSSPSTP